MNKETNIDLKHIALVIGQDEPSVFKDYIEHIANAGLLQYKGVIQYGKKAGESLYTHVLNGIFILEQLRSALYISDEEARILFTAFTIHDLNKAIDEYKSFGKLAVEKNITAEIKRLALDSFYPNYASALQDIESLVRGHSAHAHHGGERLIAKRDSEYTLGLERINALLHLIRAADAIDLSHTLEEKKHKQDFLFHLNSHSDIQYKFCSHRLTEDRALLSNVIHNSVVAYLRDEKNLIPLLFYPDGVAYLTEKGRDLSIAEDDFAAIGRHVASTISEMTAEELSGFVESKPGGIKIAPKCLDLGLPFSDIWREVIGKVYSRNRDLEAIAQKARGRLERDLDDNTKAYPKAEQEAHQTLEGEEPITAMDENTLRLGELARSYYIFLKEHFPDEAEDPWHHVYRLLELPETHWPLYEYFDARWDRGYVIAKDITLSEEEVNKRFEEDGERLLREKIGTDPKIELFKDYVSRYVVFSFESDKLPHFHQHLAHYVESQHHQCVVCSSTFPTDDWMAGDVREDITVQAFSNRLRGGPGSPKKNICDLCRIQFLIEKLNYPSVRGEKIIYLHLFPYSFLPAPFIQGLRIGINRLIRENLVERALFLRTEDAIEIIGLDQPLHLDFTALTRNDKPHPYGLYLPRYSKTVGNRLIFPLNPAGDNDSQRFLFALWNAMLLQKHFGCKVLMSDSPVATLGKDDFHDLYIANAPLAARGLIVQNDYAAYQERSKKLGTLAQLWKQVQKLFAVNKVIRSSQTKKDEMLALVQAMGESPLHIFYTAEKLLEARSRGSDNEWLLIRLSQQVFPSIGSLAHSIGGRRMTKLSAALQNLAQIAWADKLKGRSLKKNSLIMPLDEILKKLSHHSDEADIGVLQAAITEDIFEHLERIADANYRPGKTKWRATKTFVDSFFEEVYQQVYKGQLQQLLADEKLIRSAYLFYIREQISPKDEDE